MATTHGVMCRLGTMRSQHRGQWIAGPVRAQEWRQPGSMITCLPVSFLLLVLSLGVFSCLPDAVAGDDHGCKKASIVEVKAPIQGDAFLCSDAEGVRARLHVKGLQPKHAYTIWFFYWDDPADCIKPGECALEDLTPPGQCAGPLDLRGFNPLGVLGRLDSAVAPRNGKMTFAGRVRGLHLSNGSQVWLFIAAHGEAHVSDNRARARQLLTPEDPLIGAPLLGNCVDQPSVPGAIAVFNIP